MQALVIEHNHLCPPGTVVERLAERGYGITLHRVVEADNVRQPHVHNPFPPLDGFDLVVPLGAPWSVYSERVAAWVEPELELLREADRRAIPVLGICFGGQLLAAAHGGRVSRAPQPELGWAEVATTDADLVASGPWLQWHHDRWSVPPGATEVASTPLASQAFVLRRSLGVQFHPEITTSILEGWVRGFGAAAVAESGLDPEALLSTTTAQQDSARARAFTLVDAFLERVATTG